MQIQLLTQEQFKKQTGWSRTTIWRLIRKGEVFALKVTPRTLWFLPLEYEIVEKGELGRLRSTLREFAENQGEI